MTNLTPQQILQIRLQDACRGKVRLCPFLCLGTQGNGLLAEGRTSKPALFRRYARLLRQNGGHPEAVIYVIRGIWGDEVANIVESTLDDASRGEQSAESLQQTPPS